MSCSGYSDIKIGITLVNFTPKFHSVEKFTTYYSLLMPQKDWESSFRCMVLSHAISVSPLVLPFHVYSYAFFSDKHHLVFCFSPLSKVQLVFSSLKWGCEDGVMVDFVLTCAYTFWPSVRLNLCERKKKKKVNIRVRTHTSYTWSPHFYVSFWYPNVKISVLLEVRYGSQRNLCLLGCWGVFYKHSSTLGEAKCTPVSCLSWVQLCSCFCSASLI